LTILGGSVYNRRGSEFRHVVKIPAKPGKMCHHDKVGWEK